MSFTFAQELLRSAPDKEPLLIVAGVLKSCKKKLTPKEGIFL